MNLETYFLAFTGILIALPEKNITKKQEALMLRKKLESFLLILTFGLFLFSCTIEENKRVEQTNKTSEYKVSIEISNSGSIEKSRFEFEGTLDGNPIYIQEDAAGIGRQEITLSSGGKLKITVRAYSLITGEMTAFGEAEKEISGNISFEIELEKNAFDELFYLTFNNEGSETTASYYKNETVGEFFTPTRDGYTFHGWFTSPDGSGTKLTTNYSMTSNLTVYAYWTPNNPDGQYTCMFETNGGSSVSPKTVSANNAIDKPEQPIRDGYAFTGWYSDAACTAIVNFPYTVTKNITLYADWVAETSVVKVAGVKLTRTSLVFDNVGKTLNLVHVIEPTNATNTSVTWNSDNSSIVSVNGEGAVTACAVGTATVTVTTDDGGFTATCSITVKEENTSPVLSALIVTEANESTETALSFTATAKYSDKTTKDVTASAIWTSSEETIATVSEGKVTLKAAGKTDVNATYTEGGVTKNGAKQTVTVTAEGGTIDKVYLMPTSDWADASAWFAAYFFEEGAKNEWVKMEKSGDKYVCDKPSGYSTVIFCRMNPSKTELAWTSKWNQTSDLSIPNDKDTFKVDSATQWDKPMTSWLTELSGSYSGGELKATVNSEVVIEPLKPTVTISPASGSISLSGSVKVTFTNGNDTITSAKVSINGTQYDMGTTAGTFTKSVKDLGITTGGTTITVSATVTNGEGSGTANATLTTTDTPVVEDTFTWDNVNAYFVLTDRFYNGNKSNDASYGRQRKSGDEDVATFHGGDLKGLTEKIDYFDKLGVNAIWITAPYEQAHGWVGGKDGKFPHYAFHGYYTLDWTALDANMGTLDEFREFVVACHKKGIRVIMDVVMNHVGYNNQADMITYKHGKTSQTSATWLEKTNGKWDANVGVEWDNQYWESWWGPWIRSFGYESGSEYGGSCGGLPDVKSELTSSVGMAPVMKTKWSVDSSDIKKKYYNPSVANADWNGYSGDYRTDKGIAPADYQVVWLSAWVREFGIDGFRCDTAKHVEPFRWGQLKVACQAALEAWRKDNSKADDSGAKDWDENFWMTGECWGWTSISGGGEYYSTGKFDSMINFSFNGGNNWDGNYRTKYPGTSDWNSYLSINNNGDSDSNGNRDNVLSYISSHDTGLTRTNNQKEVGTGLILLPGGVQIYYGDESSREKAYTGCGDGDMFTRGDMNWNNQDLVAHWGKVGNFRKYNPAVGAGKGSAMKRTYSGAAGESKVAIGVEGTSVDVSGLFSDGTTVYNWYDGTSATVSGGKVTSFAGGNMSQPILISDKNPADFGVTF